MKRSVVIGIVVIVAVVLLAVAIPALVNVNEFRPRIEAMLSGALGRQVTLGELSFSLFSGSLRAQDLAIAEDPRFGSGPDNYGAGIQSHAGCGWRLELFHDRSERRRGRARHRRFTHELNGEADHPFQRKVDADAGGRDTRGAGEREYHREGFRGGGEVSFFFRGEIG
jgi:hypothetical protein